MKNNKYRFSKIITKSKNWISPKYRLGLTVVTYRKIPYSNINKYRRCKLIRWFKIYNTCLLSKLYTTWGKIKPGSTALFTRQVYFRGDCPIHITHVWYNRGYIYNFKSNKESVLAFIFGGAFEVRTLLWFHLVFCIVNNIVGSHIRVWYLVSG